MVRRLLAPNPSPMTLDGTNGYVVRVAPGELIAIDPGIDDPAHIEAFMTLARAERARYTGIFVTHGHPDHFPGALALRRVARAPVYAHPSATFGHDRSIDEGAQLTYADAAFRVLHAPGHARDHLVFWLEEERALFTGDVVIGRGTVVIAPPSGNMRVYQASLQRLLDDYGHAAVIYGGHGPAIAAPRAKLQEYIEHRRARETQIIDALARAPATIPALVADIYAHVDAALWPAAARQVLAYLVALHAEGRVQRVELARTLTAHEAQILNPDLRVLAGPAAGELARAELGIGTKREVLTRYSLIP